MDVPSARLTRFLTVIHTAIILAAASIFGAAGLLRDGLTILAAILFVGAASTFATRYVLGAGRHMGRLAARGAWAGTFAGPLVLFALVVVGQFPSGRVLEALALFALWGTIPAALIGAAMGAALGLLDGLILGWFVDEGDESETLTANR